MSTTSVSNEIACERALAAFIQAFDARDTQGALAQLAPDAVWFRQGQRLEGHAQIAPVIESRPESRIVRHHLSTIVARLTGATSARVRAYYAAYAHEGPERPRLVRGAERVGDYHAELVLLNGEWRISMLRAERLFEVGQ
ncbi:MAG TPA: nuclear transport factor 2 family protein [Steroidobacteraceae bacterium]|nr:nuclear transport factor 2 family protein [Steroidobacteraceae bacterium]